MYLHKSYPIINVMNIKELLDNYYIPLRNLKLSSNSLVEDKNEVKNGNIITEIPMKLSGISANRLRNFKYLTYKLYRVCHPDKSKRF